MFYRPCQGCKVTSVSVRGVPRLLTNAWNPTRWIYGDGSKASKWHFQDFSQICYDLVIFESSNHAAIGGLENSGHGEVIGAKSQVVNCLFSRHAPDVGIFEVMLWESDAQQWPFKSLAEHVNLQVNIFLNAVFSFQRDLQVNIFLNIVFLFQRDLQVNIFVNTVFLFQRDL